MVHQSVAIAANTTAWSRLFPAAVFSERYQQMTGNFTPAAIVTLAQRGDACAMQQVARFRNSLPARWQPSLTLLTTA